MIGKKSYIVIVREIDIVNGRESGPGLVKTAAMIK